jgi:hypothetical protein
VHVTRTRAAVTRTCAAVARTCAAVARTACIAAAACAVALPVVAQVSDTAGVGRIVGIILDEQTGQPIEGVAIRLTTLERPVQLSDRFGRFQLDRLPNAVHELQIEHVAYGRGLHLVNVPDGERVEVRIRLRASALVLDSLVITATARPTRLAAAGYFDRERRGWGRFFREEDMAVRMEEIVMSVPGYEIQQNTRPPFTGRRVMVRSFRGGYCQPEIWVDGMHEAWAEGDILAAVRGRDIEAVEVYRGLATPAEFLRRIELRPCGAIVVWTRR